MKVTARYCAGFNLIELMIAIAIIALLAGIAIPAYNNYIRESQFGAARMNAEPLRLALEDYWLDNGTYADVNGNKWIPGGTKTLESGNLGWRPDGDNDAYEYEVKDADAALYTIVVKHTATGRTVTCTKQAACDFD